MDIKDLAGISKPIEKLIDSISASIGVIYEPTMITRLAKAQSEAELIRVQSELNKQELLHRAYQRITTIEANRQKNIDHVVKRASENLSGHMNDEPVSEDWLLRFFEDCQSVSDSNLQIIWGKILAGETEKPGSYSRITLSVLKNMSREDALLFEKISSLFWEARAPYQENGYRFIPVQFNVPAPLNAFGVTHDECMHLSSLGLLNVSKDLYIRIADTSTLKYFDDEYLVEVQSIIPEAAGTMNIFSLTYAGKELFPLAHREKNMLWASKSPELINTSLEDVVLKKIGILT